MSMDTSTRRFLRSVGGGLGRANHSVLCGSSEGFFNCACGTGMLRSLASSSVILCLVPAFIDISLRSCGEYIVPPSYYAVLTVAWVSWHDAMCLMINLLLTALHSFAMWVHESDNLRS